MKQLAPASTRQAVLVVVAFLPAISLPAPAPALAPGGSERCALVDSAGPAGLDFTHESGISSRRHLPETMGAGLAWLDFDGDGWMDLYAVQSGPFPPTGEIRAANRLYRNLGDGRFEAVAPKAGAPEAGAADRGYGQGVLALDADGDGDVDLAVANFGADSLWLNRGDGSFERRPLGRETSAPQTAWSSSLAAADLDRDGDLDLYLARYMVYDVDEPLFCGDPETGRRRYCDPSLFEGAPDSIFRQTSRGVFEEEALPLPQAGAFGRGLGALAVDLDGDGGAEVYVSNDLDPNLLWDFGVGPVPEDLSLLSGAGVNREGRPEAGMGLAVLDGDGDADPDLFVTNFDVETNTYYENLGGLFFEDAASASGLGPASLNFLGFGVVAADFDRDGIDDLYVANGHIFPEPRRDNVGYAQPDRLFWGAGKGRFEPAACESLAGRSTVARGAAQADYDNDGDADLAVQANDGPLRLLRNDVTSGEWVGLALRGGAPNTEAVGAVVRARAGGRTLTRWIVAGDSYQSSSSRRVLVTGGAAPAEVDVWWPAGGGLRLEGVPAGRYLVVPQPSGGALESQKGGRPGPAP